MSVTQIKEAAALLPASEKAELVTWLLDFLPPSSEEDATEDSLAEARRRKEELDSGATKPLSSEEFWDSIKRGR